MSTASSLSLWDFALAVYKADGVADACLTLQDEFGADVNLLLFAAWLGARNIALDRLNAQETAALVAAWSHDIVQPLRQLRRLLKSGPLPAPNTETETLRRRIKAAELDSERIELAWLEQHAGSWPAPKINQATPPHALIEDNLHCILTLTANPDQSGRATPFLSIIAGASQRA